MRKHGFNKSLVITLVTAILFLQWSSQHIHLAGEHEHDSGQHHHVASVHQHQAFSQHADAIDIADSTHSHADNSKVVELNHVCTECHSKQAEKFAVLSLIILNYSERSTVPQIVVRSNQLQVYQSYHQYTSIGLRAPPVNS